VKFNLNEAMLDCMVEEGRLDDGMATREDFLAEVERR
jgi:hypothetical protein